MSIVLVEDHLSYRQSFRLALKELSSFEIVGEASAARDGLPLIETLQPKLAVIDFFLPDTNGISLARELKRRRLKTRTLVLGRTAHPVFVRDALQAGLGGFALKSEPIADIIEAMKQVMEGGLYLSPQLQQGVTSALSERFSNLAALSAREREILFLLIEGLSSKEIGKALFLSSKTVDAHRLHINRKLGVRSPAALARLVADSGLIAV